MSFKRDYSGNYGRNNRFVENQFRNYQRRKNQNYRSDSYRTPIYQDIDHQRNKDDINEIKNMMNQILQSQNSGSVNNGNMYQSQSQPSRGFLWPNPNYMMTT